MSTFQVIQQRPVMREQRLGSIPKDAYVQNQGSLPNLAPAAERVPGDLFEVSNGRDVMATAPARNADGTIQITSENATLTGEAHNPVKFGLLGGLTAGAAGAATGAAAGGLMGAVVGGVLAGLGGAGIGVLTARGDEVSVITREANVTEPVLTGYRAGSVDGAYVPDRPGHWFSDSGGRLHYAIPEIEHRPVGTVQFHELTHSRPGAVRVGAENVALGACAGLLAGLAVKALI